MNKDKDMQISLELGHETSLCESDFIVSSANELAFEHIAAFPNWPHHFMLIIGKEKSGKSHLAKIWQEKSNAIFVKNDMLEMLAKQGGTQPIIIEDIDRAGFDEEKLFHLLNQSLRDGRAVLMSAQSEISEWEFSTNDVLSRARLATSFFVSAPDDAQLAQMFAKLFADRQVSVAPNIISYLISRMQRSASEVVALVDLMDQLAMSRNKPISRKIASEALELRMRADDE